MNSKNKRRSLKGKKGTKRLYHNECPICFEIFDFYQKAPRQLNCKFYFNFKKYSIWAYYMFRKFIKISQGQHNVCDECIRQLKVNTLFSKSK